MKVSEIMRLFIIVSLLCIVIYIIYQFAIKPLSVFAEIKNEYDQIYLNYDNMHQNFVMHNYYKDREKELLDEKYNLNVLSYVNQEEIIKILHGYLLSSNINLTKLNFTEAFPLSLDNSINETAVETDENNYPEILMMSVNVEFNSNYGDMLKFIDGLQNNLIDMSITNMRITLFEKDIVFVVMDMNFFAVTEDEFHSDFLRSQE